jgi:hypothetical protein
MYGGADDVVGKKLWMDLALANIVGVMPPGYQTLNPMSTSGDSNPMKIWLARNAVRIVCSICSRGSSLESPSLRRRQTWTASSDRSARI